jgi:hypothetical protein
MMGIPHKEDLKLKRNGVEGMVVKAGEQLCTETYDQAVRKSTE